jgi:hypothetical protein
MVAEHLQSRRSRRPEATLRDGKVVRASVADREAAGLGWLMPAEHTLRRRKREPVTPRTNGVALETHGATPTAWDVFAKAIAFVATSIGAAGFVAFLGGAILWVRFYEAKLPADQAVAQTAKSQLLVIGATQLAFFVVLGGLAVGVIYLLRGADGRARRRSATKKVGPRLASDASEQPPASNDADVREIGPRDTIRCRQLAGMVLLVGIEMVYTITIAARTAAVTRHRGALPRLPGSARQIHPSPGPNTSPAVRSSAASAPTARSCCARRGR